MAKNYDYLFKLLLIGDSGVGKTCTLYRLCDEAFSSAFIATIGIDFKMKSIEIEGKRVKLQIWDTAGQERFRTITTAYYRGAMGIMIVFDVCNRSSFDNIKSWLHSVDEYASPDVEKIILGNKCDLLDARVVTQVEGQKLANEFGTKYIEVSAKSGLNVTEAFITMASDIKAKMDKKLEMEGQPARSSAINIGTPEKSDNVGSSSCC